MTIPQHDVVSTEVSPWSIHGSARYLDAASEILQGQLTRRPQAPSANALPSNLVMELAHLFDAVAEALRRRVELPHPVVSAVTDLAWNLTVDASRETVRRLTPPVSAPTAAPSADTTAA